MIATVTHDTSALISDFIAITFFIEESIVKLQIDQFVYTSIIDSMKKRLNPSAHQRPSYFETSVISNKTVICIFVRVGSPNYHSVISSCIKQRDRANIKQKSPSFIPPVQVCRSHQRVQGPFSSFALPNVAPLYIRDETRNGLKVRFRPPTKSTGPHPPAQPPPSPPSKTWGQHPSSSPDECSSTRPSPEFKCCPAL